MLIVCDVGQDLEPVKTLLLEDLAFDKVIHTAEGFDQFESEYPFMCVSDSSTEEDKLKARARYPSKITNEVFLGNFINSTNTLHMKQLQITRVIGLTPQSDERLSKCDDIEYHHFEYNEADKP